MRLERSEGQITKLEHTTNGYKKKQSQHSERRRETTLNHGASGHPVGFVSTVSGQALFVKSDVENTVHAS